VTRPAAPSRFPRWVYGVGDEPDPRFSLANERTFLAWIRTSLAFSAAGVALEALSLPVHPGFRLAAALVLVVLGIVAAVQAWWRWGLVERAVRCGAPLPAPVLTVAIAAGCVVAALLVFVGILLR
jgi:putative membrane protein